MAVQCDGWAKQTDRIRTFPLHVGSKRLSPRTPPPPDCHTILQEASVRTSQYTLLPIGAHGAAERGSLVGSFWDGEVDPLRRARAVKVLDLARSEPHVHKVLSGSGRP
jgi:hypothetical protein